MSIFMKYGHLRGESADAGHVGWVDVDEVYFHGVKRRISSNSGTRFDRESAVTEIRDITLIRYMDQASPGIFLESCCGDGKDLTLHYGKTTSTGSGNDLFLEQVLEHAVIADYKVYSSIYSRRRPSEKLTISFTGLLLRYIPHGDDGTPLSPLAVSYSTRTNTTA
ncbi:MAG: type VI secretion system tube protein Hcp [Aquisalimonadaceae bacterium]